MPFGLIMFLYGLLTGAASAFIFSLVFLSGRLSREEQETGGIDLEVTGGKDAVQ